MGDWCRRSFIIDETFWIVSVWEEILEGSLCLRLSERIWRSPCVIWNLLGPISRTWLGNEGCVFKSGSFVRS